MRTAPRLWAMTLPMRTVGWFRTSLEPAASEVSAASTRRALMRLAKNRGAASASNTPNG
jgi:hypothetical protein